MNRGGALFLDDADRRRFPGAVAELPERFALEMHAFVLMANHYPLLARTREPNLSQAMRRLVGCILPCDMADCDWRRWCGKSA
jgi:putative transposase